ncbi:MAG: MATE family efflux transporter [Spirochaetales bacterium]|nr:MATE family efflux transporter [Spirochaetales bacterium]
MSSRDTAANQPIEIPDNRSLYRSLIRLAIPIMLNNLLQMLLNLADAFYLGKLGAAAVSAPTISFNLIFFLVVFGMSFGMAGTTLIAQSKGKRDQERVDFYLGQTTTVLMSMSVVIAIVGITLGGTILRLMQVPEDAFEFTRQYMTIIFAGMPIMFVGFILRSALQGVGNSVTPLIVQSIAIGLNLILDPLVIFGIGPFPRLEVAGAAYATVFSRLVASIVALSILVRGRRGIRLQLRHMKPDWHAIRRLASIGLPASIGQGLSALGFTVLQGVVNTFGTAVVAAFGIGNRIVGLFNMPAFGFSQATTALVGQCLGAKRKDQAVTVVKQSVITVAIFIVSGMTLTFFFGSSFVRFFVSDPDVVQYGATMFRIISMSVVLFALFTVTVGAFQGGGDTKPVMFLNIGRLWGLRLPVAYLLAIVLNWGPDGIWWSMFFSNLVTATAGFLVLRRGRWLSKIDPDTI